MNSPAPATDGLVPLTHAQAGLWLIDQMSPGGTSYNMVAPFRLRGPLRVSALRGALDRLAGRHEVLRSVVEETGEGPMLRRDGLRPVPFRVDELCQVAADEREGEVRRRIAEQIALPYDLARGPLFSAHLFRLSETDHVLALLYHHIVCDGASLPVLFRELAELYRAQLVGEPDQLEPLPLSYADYARWQRQHLADSATGEKLSWWRKQLTGAPALLDLPTDRPRPAVLSSAGGRHRQKLPELPWAEVAAAATSYRSTPFMFLLAGWAGYCARVSGQTDVVLGTPTGNRFRSDAQQLIGHFVNYLPLRLDLSGDPTAEELVRRTRRTALDYFSRQDVPFEKLVEELRPARSLSHAPLVQVMFGRDTMPATLELAELAVEPFRVDLDTAQWDLAVACAPDGAGTQVAIRYATDLFDAATVEQMADQYGRLVTAVVREPSTRLSRLPLLDRDQHRLLINGWSDGGRPYRAEPPVHEQIATVAQRHPDLVAVRCGGQQLSYRQLDIRANQLARALAARGIGTDDVVGIHLPRSLNLIVSILGTLRAGAAYLPLDTEWPVARVQHLLASAGATQVVTSSDLSECLPEECDPLALDAMALDGLPTGPTAAPAGPASLAYVIYTSGSTGAPKGVAVAHAGLANRLRWMQETFALNETDRVLHKTPVTFDVSLWELLWPLLAGACLVIAAPHRHRDPDYLVELVRREGITTMHFVPPMLAAFLDQPDVAQCRSLRQVICSGQELPAEVCDRFNDRLPARLYNLYGPTEASIDVTAWRWQPAEKAGDRSPARVPIGRPITGVRAYVLDGNLTPAAPGARGELYLGGVQLARGYIGRPDLTAERFVPDPVSGESGARLYRTGDLVRWNTAGALEFFGRRDHQLKLRGYRVEPAEIEEALLRCPGVRQSVVTLHRGPTGDEQLVAYLVTTEEIDRSGLREALRRTLPDHLIPAAFVRLAELPLTTSGKVDRAALPPPATASDTGRGSTGGSGPPAPPASRTERLVASVWQEVLGLDSDQQIGVHDNFFDLGGHSLLVTRVRARLSEELGQQLRTVTLYQHPTVAALARHLADTGPDVTGASAHLREPTGPQSAAAAAVARQRGRRRLAGQHARASAPTADPVPAPPQRAASAATDPDRQHTWPLTQTLAEVCTVDVATGGITYNHVGGLRLRGALDEAALQWAFTRLGERHEMLRATFPVVDGERRLWCDPQSVIPFTTSEPAGGEEEMIRVGTGLIRAPFNLDAGPLMQVYLLRLGQRERVLFIRFHHIVADGGSMRRLLQEITTLYAARVNGQEDPLPPLAWQFGEYAKWEQEYLTTPPATAAFEWWRERLIDAPPALELPADRPRTGEATVSGAEHRHVLEGLSWDGIADAAKRLRRTRFLLLFGMYAVLLAELTGARDLVIGTPLSGRLHPAAEQIIGNFANSMPIRVDLSGDPSLAEVIYRAQRAVLPGTRRLQAMAPAVERAVGRPLTRVEFTVSEIPGAVLNLPNIDLSVVKIPEETSRNDLLLTTGMRGDGKAYALFKYKSALFRESTVMRWAARYDQLIRLAVSDPEVRMRQLPPAGRG